MLFTEIVQKLRELRSLSPSVQPEVVKAKLLALDELALRLDSAILEQLRLMRNNNVD